MALDDAGDHVCKVGLRLDAGESERPLDGVGVDLDAPVVEEQAQPRPASQSLADRLGQVALAAQEAELLPQPRSSASTTGRLRS